MEPLKEMFGFLFIDELTAQLNSIYPVFNKAEFKNKLIDSDYAMLGLNGRMRRITQTMRLFLPDDFKKSLSILHEVIPKMKTGYTTIIFPDYVGLYGKNNFDLSLKALRDFTSYGTSEFAIREFLKLDFERTIDVMYSWARDNNPHVRRLASEGSRPRLPWSFKLNEVMDNPYSTELILNRLKTDNELYVKKSVANHLNDISKDNTDAFFTIINKWNHDNKNTNWIIKHAGRNLIKKGNPSMLKLMGVNTGAYLSSVNLNVKTDKLRLGDYLSFEAKFKSEKKQKLIIDYAVFYVKQKSKNFKKVFKLKILNVEKGEVIKISKKQLIKNFSTRKHFAGEHKIELLINGISVSNSKFYLEIVNTENQ